MTTQKLFQQAEFLLSAAELKQLPKDKGYEIAIVGRSNSGKSTILNVLCQQKNLARTSKTPGRTQLINVFTLDEERRITDLPGYGYAKVPASVKAQWESILETYLETRTSLQGLLLIMDSRHPLQPLDHLLLEWANHAELPQHILLNKVDKLSKNEANKTLFSVKKSLAEAGYTATVQLFSALKRQGLDECYAVLDQWLNIS